MKKHLGLIVLAVGIVITGCEKKQEAPSAPEKVGENPVNAPTDYLSTLAKTQKKAVKAVETASINQAINMFDAEEGRHPKDLNELVEKKYLPELPKPPFGMKFEYNAKTGSVKIVPQ